MSVTLSGSDTPAVPSFNPNARNAIADAGTLQINLASEKCDLALFARGL